MKGEYLVYFGPDFLMVARAVKYKVEYLATPGFGIANRYFCSDGRRLSLIYSV